MPKYVKFMKDTLSNKRRLGEFESVALTEGCTAMLKNKLPPILEDPGSFTIPCSIGNHYIGNILCDLGASINLMPISIFKKLRIGKARPIIATLQLADKSYVHTEGKIEDVLEGELTMRINDQQLTFNVFDALKCADPNEECHAVEFVDIEFDLEIKDRKGSENQVADHLSRLEVENEYGESQMIKDEFPNEKILLAMALPWYADIVNFLVNGLLIPVMNYQGQRKFLHDVKQYY
ncbi:uncharacterized protein LOC105781605 [Gossypium raimondii]|uniref:uncharacterized protein LOC105781605 n=1 Tax=Gossypium raimondii TaxID=29730 RepID=UPI00063AD73E|nr:uncharacterized protein LOC105781605 [Gossypium raimondii]